MELFDDRIINLEERGYDGLKFQFAREMAAVLMKNIGFGRKAKVERNFTNAVKRKVR